MTDDVSKRLKEALGRLGITVAEPTARPADVWAQLREAAEQSPAYAQDRERRQLQEDVRRLEAQAQAVGRMIEEARTRHTGRPFRGSGPSRLVDLKEPVQHAPRPREKGTVALNEATVRAEFAASLARLGIHTSQEEEDL